MYYHGIKVHIVARKRENALPDAEIIVLEEAARQDAPVFQQILPMLANNQLFGDMAYQRSDAIKIESQQNLRILTPIKKTKGQDKLSFFSAIIFQCCVPHTATY